MKYIYNMYMGLSYSPDAIILSIVANQLQNFQLGRVVRSRPLTS